MQNKLVLTATVERSEALRYTPAGLPVLEMWLAHHSQQTQAGFKREVQCSVQAVMMGDLAKQYAGQFAGSLVNFSGFLCQRSQKNPRLVFHIENVEFVKG